MDMLKTHLESLTPESILYGGVETHSAGSKFMIPKASATSSGQTKIRLYGHRSQFRRAVRRRHVCKNGRIDRSADPQHEERRCVSCRWGVSTFRLYFTSSPYNYATFNKVNAYDMLLYDDGHDK